MATFASEPGATTAAIRAMDADFVRAALARDAATLVEDFYADDATLLPPDHPAVTGKEAIRAYWEAVLASGLQSLTLDTTHVEVSGNLAYGTGRFSTVVEPPGAPRAERTGKYLVVYRRIDYARWRAVADMFSGNGP